MYYIHIFKRRSLNYKPKKLLLGLITIFILTLGFFVFFNKSNQSVLETYTLNRQDLMKIDKIVLDEKSDEFDEKRKNID